MAVITKAQILTKVNLNLNRAETDIDEEILAVLKDLSGRDNFLSHYVEALGDTIAIGTPNYDPPDDFKELISIVLADATDDGDELEEITWQKYLRNVSGSTSNNEPTSYVENDEQIWLYPTPDYAYTPKIYFYRYHPDDITTILFTEPFRKCIYDGVTAEVAGKFGLDQEAKFTQKYEYGISKLRSNIKRKPAFVGYNNI